MLDGAYSGISLETNASVKHVRPAEGVIRINPSRCTTTAFTHLEGTMTESEGFERTSMIS